MSVLMFINIKGGVAKTTNAIAVSQFLAERGNRVLLIDADHQCAASEILLGEERLNDCDCDHRTLHDLLNKMLKEDFDTECFANYLEEATLELASYSAGQLHVLPCSIRMDDFQHNHFKAKSRFEKTSDYRAVREANLRAMKSWLRKSFDYTIIDCPPSIPLQVQMLLRVSNSYIVPCVPERLSLRGASHLLDRLRRLKASKIRGLGTLWTLHRAQNKYHVENVAAARRDRDSVFPGMPKPFDSVIPNAVAIAGAFENIEESTHLSYSSEHTKLYRRLVEEIVERCGLMAV